MNLLKTLCTDTFNNCMVVMFKKPINKSEQKNDIELKRKDDSLYDEENEAFQSWPTDTNISNQGNQNITKTDMPISKITTKPMLIGNLDEDKLVKKATLIKDDDNPLFDDIQPKLLNPPLKIKNISVEGKPRIKDNNIKNINNANNTKNIDSNNRLDEDVGKSDGWLDPDDIKI